MNTRLSVKLKILIPASIIIICMCALIGFLTYRTAESGFVASGVEEATMAATIAGGTVDGDAVAALKAGDEDSEAYKSLLADLRETRDICGIKYLYTLYTDGNKFYYGVDTDDSSEQAQIGDEFATEDSEIASAFAGKTYAQDYIDYTEDGELITVYYPIKSSDGSIRAIIGCDYDAATVVEHLADVRNQIIVVSLISLAAALAIIGFVVTVIMGNLRKVDGKIYDIVNSEGDLTKKLDIHTGDEMEQIAGNVNSLLEYIRSIMKRIAQNSAKLNETSQEVVKSLSGAQSHITGVSAAMEEMSASMEQTNASLNQASEAIREVSKTVGEINAGAQTGSTDATSIMKKADEVYNGAVREQQDAKEKMQELASVMNDKIEKSKAVEAIGTLTENILDITRQTSLLALNASIEAARAGEAGRGFAVVAGEIGKLASNSAEAATKIQQVSTEVITSVNELAAESSQMIAFMEEAVGKGYASLLTTSSDYRSDVDDMGDKMRSFAESSRQLKGRLEEIKTVIENVDTAVGESTKAITEVAETSTALSQSMGDIQNEANINQDIASSLHGEVDKFKLD